VTVTSVSAAVARVWMNAWNPNRLALAGAVKVWVGTMSG